MYIVICCFTEQLWNDTLQSKFQNYTYINVKVIIHYFSLFSFIALNAYKGLVYIFFSIYSVLIAPKLSPQNMKSLNKKNSTEKATCATMMHTHIYCNSNNESHYKKIISQTIMCNYIFFCSFESAICHTAVIKMN